MTSGLCHSHRAKGGEPIGRERRGALVNWVRGLVLWLVPSQLGKQPRIESKAVGPSHSIAE